MLRFVGFFTFMSFLICGVTYFILKKRLKLNRTGNQLLLAFLIIVAALMIGMPAFYRLANVSIDNPFQQFAQFAQYFFMGWVGMTMLIFVAAEIIQLFVRLAMKPFDPQKRIFLTEGVARGLVVGTSVAALGGLAQAEMGPNIKPIEIKLKTLPGAFDGMVIAQISDVHVGPLIHEDYLNRVVDQVMSLNPDIIVITGDLVDGSVMQLKNLMSPLTRLKAKEGIYFCTGNHEYYSGAEGWIAYLGTIGIQVLGNSNQVITRKNASGIDEKILMAGVHDWQAWKTIPEHKADPMKAAKTDASVDCKILLAHNPQSTDANAEAGFHLQLSGHTHAGQFYPFVFVAGLAHKYFEGLYRVNETMQVYVNRGTGYWGPPNRLGKSSEITHITLKKA